MSGDHEEAEAAAWTIGPDEVAGVVDAFGALTRDELRRALSELAYRQGADVDPDGDVVGDAIADARATYHLLAVGRDALAEGAATETVGADDAGVDAASDDAEFLVVGPSAFPTLPEGGEDLHRILAVDRRRVDRDGVARAASERVRAEVASLLADVGRADADAEVAVDADLDVPADVEATEAVVAADRLVDVTYDVEAIGGDVDLSDARAGLDEVLE